jgi:broad specificity phosphatase PhoE
VTTLLIARHGESDWNREARLQGQVDRPLTDRGRDQAAALVTELSDAALAAIYSSDLCRARETAEFVAKQRGLVVESMVMLRETDIGSWAGLTYSEVANRFPDGFEIWKAGGQGWTDGESYEDVARRVRIALADISMRHPAAEVLVVSHADPIATLAASALGLDLRSYFRDKAIEELKGNDDGAFAVGNGSLVRLTVEDGQVVRYEHLRDRRASR